MYTLMSKLRPKKSFFKTSERFASDVALAEALKNGIRPDPRGRAFLIADYDNPNRPLIVKGCLVVRVRRRNGYARVYVKGYVVTYRLIGRRCTCCEPYFEGRFYSGTPT